MYAHDPQNRDASGEDITYEQWESTWITVAKAYIPVKIEV